MTALVAVLQTGVAHPEDSPLRKDSGQSKIGTLIERLGDDDVQVREEAARKLIQLGPLAKRQLQAARQSTDPEIAGRAQDVLGIIYGVRFTLKGARKGVISGTMATAIVVRVTNVTSKEVIHHRKGFKLTLRLLELKEEAPDKFNLWARGGGRAGSGCILSEGDFVQLKPYESHHVKEQDVRTLDLEIAPDLLSKDPDLAWKLWTSRGVKMLRGRYAIVMTYRYNRADYVSVCSKKCPTHDDPRMMWNRCSGYPLEATFEFEVK